MRYRDFCLQARLIIIGVIALAAVPLGAEEKGYRIGPGDVIEIKVWQHETLDRVLTVPESGEFSFPMIGTVKAGGLTASELERELVKRLSDGFIKNPQVAVNIKEYRSRTIIVFGEVKKPGTIHVVSQICLLELLSQVEGLTEKADRKVVILRPSRGSPVAGRNSTVDPSGRERITVDLDRLLSGDLSSNQVLHAGDIVIFPSRETALEKVNVLGEVNRPGPYPLRKDTTLVSLITEAGGPTDKAGRVLSIIRAKPSNQDGEQDAKNAPVVTTDKVERFDLDKVMTQEVGADVVLRNGDTIILSKNTDVESKFFILGQVKTPGGYPATSGLTVFNAVSLAGGFTPYASYKKGVRLVQIKDGKLVESVVPMTYKVQPGDTIIIPEGWF